MKPTIHIYLLRRPCLLVLLLALLGSGLLAPAAPSSAAQTYQVYLPLIASAGGPTPAVQFSFDTGRASHAAIGPEGGLLTATAADGTQFALTIPPEALDFTEVITMTPASAVAGLPLSGGLAGAVNLEPAGLSFYTPATLAITPATPPAGPLTIGFAFDGTGSQFHLRPTTEAPNARIAASEVPITMEILWIRPVGAGSGTPEDIARQQAQPAPVDPMDAAEQALLDETRHMIVLREDYNNVVEPDLRRATTDSSKVDSALRQFDQWMRWVEVYGLASVYDDQIAHAKALLIDVLKRASVASADRCYEQKRPEEGFALLRWARYARKYLPGSPQIAAIEARISKCLVFKLSFRTVLTEEADLYGWRYDLHADLTLRAGVTMRATASGPLIYDSVSWIGDDSCSITGQGSGSTFDAASRRGLQIAPVSRMSPAVRVTLTYDPGTPGEMKQITCPGGGGQSGPTQDWRRYYSQLHAYEAGADGFTAQATIVGAGSFEGWVYAHSGTGANGTLTEATQIDIAHVPER